MRGTFLALTACSFACLWGVGQEYVLFVSFVILFANFTTFCLLYNVPVDRARRRITEQLRLASPHSDAAQRLATAVIKPTAGDRHLGFGPMPVVNLVTGLMGIALLAWGIIVRVFGI